MGIGEYFGQNSRKPECAEIRSPRASAFGRVGDHPGLDTFFEDSTPPYRYASSVAPCRKHRSLIEKCRKRLLISWSSRKWSSAEKHAAVGLIRSDEAGQPQVFAFPVILSMLDKHSDSHTAGLASGLPCLFALRY